MKIEDLITFIDGQVALLNENDAFRRELIQISVALQTQALPEHLVIHSQLLKMNKWKFTVKTGLFSSRTTLFVDLLKQAKEPVARGEDLLDYDTKFYGKHINVALKIYHELYDYMLTQHWEYNYPVDQQKAQVMNQVIGEWQVFKMREADAKKAYEDFKRDYYIEGKYSQDDSEVDVNLEMLVSKLTEKSRGDNEKILQWLKQHGGQEMSYFNYLVFAGEYTDGSKELPKLNQDENWTIGKAEKESQDWYVQDGKAYMNLSTYVITLQGGANGMLMHPKGQRVKFFNMEDALTVLERIKQTPIDAVLNPLMYFRTKVRLDIDITGRVIPIVESLHVEGYCSELHAPQDDVMPIHSRNKYK